MDEAIKTKGKGGILVYIIHNITKAIWKDRNQSFFHNRTHSTPLHVSLEQTRLELASSFNNKSPEARWRQGLRALNEINALIATLDRPGHDVIDRCSQANSGVRPPQEMTRPPVPEQNNSQSTRIASQSANYPTERIATASDRSREAFRASPSALGIGKILDKAERSSADISSVHPYSMRDLPTEIERICSEEGTTNRLDRELEIEHYDYHATRNSPTVLAPVSRPDTHSFAWNANTTWQTRDHDEN
ncbi:hypothetical protein R1flu_016954 [Riccia fluitans]|uniref:Uncharacterized protein n=1 Tax=Riccia fluitans TaxID=41844 RepID=A0ABD1YNA9_9MARC